MFQRYNNVVLLPLSFRPLINVVRGRVFALALLTCLQLKSDPVVSFLSLTEYILTGSWATRVLRKKNDFLKSMFLAAD